MSDEQQSHDDHDDEQPTSPSDQPAPAEGHHPENVTPAGGEKTKSNGAQPDDAAKQTAEPARPAEELPIPVARAVDPKVLAARTRLRHRRKRYTLYLIRSSRRRQQERSQSRQRSILLTIGTVVGVLLALVGTTVSAAVSYYQSQSDVLASLQNTVTSTDSVRIFDRYGTLLYQLNKNGVKRSICTNQIPKEVINATVAIEDHTFWTNDGVDLPRIIAAAYDDYTHKTIQQGASTITQQLIKQTVLDSQETLDRKVKEAILSFGITESGQYSKSQIITMYLNTVPYGPDIYGIDSAAYEYFGYSDDQNAAGRPCTGITGKVAAQHIDLAQASFLAGIPQNPNQNNPLTSAGLSSAFSRQQQVLKAMVQYGYITQAQSDAAWKESHGLNFLHPPAQTENKAPHFVTYVIQQLQDMVDTGQLNLSSSGLDVYTTLDLPLEQTVSQIMYDHLFTNDRGDYGNLFGAGNNYIRDSNVSDSAAVIAEQATGDIRVLLGSWDITGKATKTPFGKPVNTQFDVATDGYRSPGSSFKPLVYISAYNMGWDPAMTINDSPVVFPNAGGPNGGVYKPLDAEQASIAGEMTLRRALQWSMDIPAIKALDFVGVNNLLNTMARLGVSYNGTPGLASAIGSLGVHLIDMVQAYATFANYGRRVPLNSIDHIVDGQGNTIYQYSPPRGQQVFSPQVSYLLTSVLSDDQSRVAPNPFGFGSCSPLYLYTSTQGNCSDGNPGFHVPAASKTGTTDNFGNDWAMGYTTEFTGGVWVGNTNEADGMKQIDGITGAAPIWHRMMLAAYGCKVFPYNPAMGSDGESVNAAGCNSKTVTDFAVPQGVVRATYSSNGITSTDWFLASSVPDGAGQGTGNGGPINHICLNDATNDWRY
ncbi:MAG TPA: transglycosylase domain-containing protein, partial [Ktedonobacterales bacterium]|nr:transglycosylase domain-containing protein [Ktedonobacterales bacterium]